MTTTYNNVKSTLRAVLTTFYMILIILTIPISFQIGGVYCGLAFTVTLFNIYWILTTLSVLFKRNFLLQILYYSQHLLIPSLLTLFLSVFNNKNINLLKNENLSYYKFVLKPWRYFIINSTPLFTMLEGLCTILAIQSIGQTFHWLKYHKSESWVIISLLSSGGIITTSLYFLYRIYSFPIEISLLSASLIGAILTFCSGLGLYGIISKKGSTIESSLLFGYIVRCIYETFPELSNLASNEIGFLISSATNQFKNEIQYLPIFLNDSITQLVSYLTLNVPNSFQTIIEFLIATSKTITPSILINLAYRIAVFYSATRIIPALKNPAPSTKSMKLIYLFSPCIIIAVYTHLMMQYSNELDQELCIWGWWYDYGLLNTNNIDNIDEIKIFVHPWQFWNWINMFSTLSVYAFEVFGEQSTDEDHWKVD